MSKYNYYLEDIERNDTSDSDIHVAIISNYNHPCCVRIYGSDDDLTERVIKVLKGLNETD